MILPDGFKPMLAATLKSADEAHKLKYPAYISPKIDGVRNITDRDGKAFSRNGKEWANRYVVREFQEYGLPLLDGELGIGNPLDPAFFNRTSGFLRREDDNFNEGIVDFYVFDRIDTGGYETRFVNHWPSLRDQFENAKLRGCRINFFLHEQRKVLDEEAFQGWEDVWYKRGWEGTMGRHDIEKEYKFGRASIKSQELVKCKRFVDTEGVIVGFVEAMQNNNEAEEDAWGRTKRSSHQENKTPLGRVGVLLVRDPLFEGEVRLGTGIGLTHELREHMWKNQEQYLGRVVTYAFQAGADYEKARFGSFKGWRDDGI